MTFWLRLEKQYLKFSAAHFTLFQDGREGLHGHNYSIMIEVEASSTEDGFVVNFQPLKQAARQVCDHLDERVLLPQNPRIQLTNQQNSIDLKVDQRDAYRFPAGEVLIMPVPNITCEALAYYITNQLIEKRSAWDDSLRVKRLRVWVEETPGQQGGYEAEMD